LLIAYYVIKSLTKKAEWETRHYSRFRLGEIKVKYEKKN